MENHESACCADIQHFRLGTNMACEQGFHRVMGKDSRAASKSRGVGERESDWVERFIEESPVLGEAEAMRVWKLGVHGSVRCEVSPVERSAGDTSCLRGYFCGCLPVRS